MRTTETRVLALLLLVAAGCRAERSTKETQRVILAGFSGEVDALTGAVRLRGEPRPASGEGASWASALVELPVAADGVPGSGPPDTVELVTESVSSVPGGCGAVDGFEGSIRLRSFYAGAVLTNVHIELLTLTPTGHEACNSAPAAGDLSAALGLWDYGTIGRAGTGRNSALRPWRFRLPDMTNFSFRGRVVGDLVTADPTPPATVATPGAGTYASGRSVELRCTDAETGCAATYYTTDGTPPTTASPVYSAPIPIASSFTLRWFSVDAWGNEEAVQSADYVLDAVPPTVASVTPTAGKVGVPVTTTVAVTFSEPVDPASIDAASIAVGGPAGAVAGTFAADPTHRTFTFTPASALQPEAQYTVTVTSAVRDLAGNALTPAFASSFYTVTSRRAIQPVTSATLLNHAIAYDSSGNALAAWSALTQGGAAVVYATYSSASRSWSAANVLATIRGNTLANPVRVATDGSQFLVVWCNYTSNGVQAVRVQNGTPSAIATLTTDGGSLVARDLTVSATGTNRFLVARGFSWNVEGWAWNGSAWSARATLGSGSAPILSGSTVYYLGGDNASVMASTFSGSAWGTPVAIATTGATQGSPVGLSVATYGSSTIVAYTTNKGHVWAVLGTGTSFGSAYDVSGSGSEATTPLAVAAGALSGEYAVVWVTASGKAYGAFRNGGFWPGSPTSLASANAAEVSLAGYSYGFVAALTLRDPGSSVTSLWAAPSAGSVGSRTWSSLISLESGAQSVAEAIVCATGTRAVIHWTQADASEHQVVIRPYEAGNLGATETPSAPAAIPGSPAAVRLAANAAGEVLAVWQQDDGGGTSVFAALHRAAGWGTAVKVVAHAGSPDVASNGSDFLVVAAADSTPTAAARTLVAVPCAGNTCGPPEVVASGSGAAVVGPRVASDGQGYAAVWSRGSAVEAAVRNGGSWLATHALGSGMQGALAGRPGEYLFVWTDGASFAPRQVWASGGGASWAWGPTSYPDSLYVGELEVAAGRGGFFAVYRSTSGLVTGWSVVGGVTGPKVRVGVGTTPCDGLRVAASGSRYLVGWNCSDSLATAETDGLATPSQVGHVSGFSGLMTPALGFAVAGGQDGAFRLLYSRIPSQFTPADVYARTSAGGAWGATTVVDDRLESSQAAVALTWDGGAYLALWGQTTAASPIVDDLVGSWAF